MWAQKVDGNSALIADNRAAIARQAEDSASHKSELHSLSARVADLERVGPPRRGDVGEHRRALLSDEYQKARRSIKFWPVKGNKEDELWEGAGNFIHDVLMVGVGDVCQDDIEGVTKVLDHTASINRDEVLVTFLNSRKRDLVVSHSINLGDKMDTEGRSTAGIRLEIPGELSDTFRLLSRFGTRLRARHGAGTKRHIKLDDFRGSLYTSSSLVTLPGRRLPRRWPVMTWTPQCGRRTPTLRRDLLRNWSRVLGNGCECCQGILTPGQSGLGVVQHEPCRRWRVPRV